jgi:hypothetical protein
VIVYSDDENSSRKVGFTHHVSSVTSRRVIISRHGYDAHRYSTVIFVCELLAPWSRVDVLQSS